MKKKSKEKIVEWAKRKPLASEGLFHPKTDYVLIFYRYDSTPPKTFVSDASRPKSRLNSLSSVETNSANSIEHI